MLSFGKGWDIGGRGIILGDNPAGDCIYIKGFNSNELFQISQDCETENTCHRHFVW